MDYAHILLIELADDRLQVINFSPGLGLGEDENGRVEGVGEGRGKQGSDHSKGQREHRTNLEGGRLVGCKEGEIVDIRLIKSA